ncbi:hypothetical protein LTR36_004873 [Oleoguttula mirabilis]|uniref:Uncharacterized protein n=1 Tax=Oleoguttula mirabilis TaxID=1507867 RepID=A0AAV9JF34_9PEZI|nr:hypothetical protein LTR36_004873 [Oleoguttula mirabilis]
MLLDGLSCANKQLRQECLSLYYGMNVFSFTPFSGTKRADHHKVGVQVETDPTSYHPDEKAPLVLYSEYKTARDTRMFGIRLPPLAVRKMMSHLELTFTVPESGGIFDMSQPDGKRKYYDSRADWLYPVRQLNVLGFFGLQSLAVTIRFSQEIASYSGPGMGFSADKEVGLKDWVAGEKKRMSIDAKEVVWRYERFY